MSFGATNRMPLRRGASPIRLGCVHQHPPDFAPLGESQAAWFQGEGDARIEALILARSEAKARRDFAKADRIRAELADEGVVLEDGPEGTTWRRA